MVKHIKLLSSEESAHALLDEVCDMLGVARDNPSRMLGQIRFINDRFYSLMQSQMLLEFLKKCTRAKDDKELADRFFELSHRDKPYKPTEKKIGYGKSVSGDELVMCKYFCAGCGFEVVPSQRFCPLCGQRHSELRSGE